MIRKVKTFLGIAGILFILGAEMGLIYTMGKQSMMLELVEKAR